MSVAFALQHGIQCNPENAWETRDVKEPSIDFGVYGKTAVGYQVTDEVGQTLRYEMLFGPHHVQLAEDRWQRLSLYARPLESI